MEESRKLIYAAFCKNLRDVVTLINKEELQREDLFSLIKENDGYALLYFK